MVDKKEVVAVVARKHAALENICRSFLVGLSPTCPNTRAATALHSCPRLPSNFEEVAEF